MQIRKEKTINSCPSRSMKTFFCSLSMNPEETQQLRYVEYGAVGTLNVVGCILTVAVLSVVSFWCQTSLKFTAVCWSPTPLALLFCLALGEAIFEWVLFYRSLRRPSWLMPHSSSLYNIVKNINKCLKWQDSLLLWYHRQSMIFDWRLKWTNGWHLSDILK